MLKFNSIFSVILFVLIISCAKEPKPQADQIYINAKIYTVDSAQAWAEAIAIDGEKILAVGPQDQVLKLATDRTEIIDLGGKFMMPGFIEGHGHYGGLGNSKLNLNLVKTKSWSEILDSVEQRVLRAKPGDWIYGRGWHQEKWVDSIPFETIDGYPVHDALSSISPNNPVVLTHASGHGAMANEAAMHAAGISSETADPEGGRILRNAHGEPIGIFEEKATAQLYKALNAYYASLPKEQRIKEQRKAWELAEQACFEAGITSFQDAGTSKADLQMLKQLAEKDSIQLRLWMMLREDCETMSTVSANDLPWIGIGNSRFTVRAIKTELDGALGSYGAWLLQDYSDKPGFRGQNTTPIDEVECIADLAYRKGMQLCVHAIGDKANRLTLDLMEKFAAKTDTVLRWRNEHSQHLHPDDIPRFAQTGMIASMQGVHAISDAPFVVDRLGEKRAREGAYAWRSLWDSGAIVTGGTDTPVEDVSAVHSLYAMITRIPYGKERAFFEEQCLSREEAIQAYTLNNAYAAFEEQEKGSLSKGKLADFIVLDKNLLECDVLEIPETQVLRTYIGGKLVYQK